MKYTKEEMQLLMDEIEKDYQKNGITLKRNNISWYNGNDSIAGNCMDLFNYKFIIEEFNDSDDDEYKRGIELEIKFWKEDNEYIIGEYGGQISHQISFSFPIMPILNDFISSYNNIEAEIEDAESYGGIFLSAEKSVSGAKEFCETLEKYKKFVDNFKFDFYME